MTLRLHHVLVLVLAPLPGSSAVAWADGRVLPSARDASPQEQAEPSQTVPQNDNRGDVTPGAPTVTLPAAVRLALERNYGMLNARDSLAAASFRERAVFAEFLPQVSPRAGRVEGVTSLGIVASESLPWTGGNLSVNGLLTSNTSIAGPFPKASGLSVRLVQPLLRGAGPTAAHYDLQNSRRFVETQGRALVLAKQRLAIQVTAAFYAVVAQRQLVAVSHQSWQRTVALQRASEARLEVGLASKLDVFRAEVQAAQTQEALIRQEAALETELEQFRALLALPPSDPLEPEAASLPDELPTESEPLDTLVARALVNRLELQEARGQVEDGRRTLRLARQTLLPQLDLDLSYHRNGLGSSFGEAWRVGNDRLLFGFSTSYPLARASEKADRAIASLDLATRERSAVQAEQEVEAEVRRAHRELERIRKSFELQKRGVEAAQQQQRLASLRYQRGLASNFDVVDAEGSLLFAKSALVSLVVSHEVAMVELRRAVGTLDVEREFGQ